jgi:hypothetical protein
MNNHVMKLVSREPNGDGEWICPECGRTVDVIAGVLFVIRHGNKNATHNGLEDEPESLASTSGKFNASDLSVWEKALENIDL